MLNVKLIAHTPEPEKTCALAARTCYSAMEYDELKALGKGCQICPDAGQLRPRQPH